MKSTVLVAIEDLGFEVNAGERLGLSATPVRYGDPEGTEAIMGYFGGVVKPVYSLKDAIHDGVLTRYFYYPKEMHLSPTEQEDWNSLTKQINKLYARLMAGSSSGEVNCMSNYRMRSLMLQRADSEKCSPEDYTCWRNNFQNYQKGQKWIVYCDNQTQLSAVLALC